MKTRILISSAALAFATLTACGGTDSSALDGGATYSLQSGKYAVSNVQTVERDWCGILPGYQAAGRHITLTEDGGVVTFNLDNESSPVAEWLPSATLNGNVLAWPVRANFSPDRTADGCEFGVDETVSGALSADDTLELRLDLQKVDLSDTPGTCTPQDAQADSLPCTSSITFTAKRVP